MLEEVLQLNNKKITKSKIGQSIRIDILPKKIDKRPIHVCKYMHQSPGNCNQRCGRQDARTRRPGDGVTRAWRDRSLAQLVGKHSWKVRWGDPAGPRSYAARAEPKRNVTVCPHGKSPPGKNTYTPLTGDQQP